MFIDTTFNHSQELSDPKTACICAIHSCVKVFLNEVINHIQIILFGQYQKKTHKFAYKPCQFGEYSHGYSTLPFRKVILELGFHDKMQNQIAWCKWYFTFILVVWFNADEWRVVNGFFHTLYRGDLNEKKAEMNLCSKFSISTFNEFYIFA